RSGVSSNGGSSNFGASMGGGDSIPCPGCGSANTISFAAPLQGSISAGPSPEASRALNHRCDFRLCRYSLPNESSTGESGEGTGPQIHDASYHSLPASGGNGRISIGVAGPRTMAYWL